MTKLEFVQEDELRDEYVARPGDRIAVFVLYEEKAPDASWVDPYLPIPPEERRAWHWQIKIGRFSSSSDIPYYHTLEETKELAQKAFDELLNESLVSCIDRKFLELQILREANRLIAPLRTYPFTQRGSDK